MAKILLTWELGGGSGHVVNLRPFACGLEAAGHTVTAALRNIGKGRDLLGGKAVTFLQAHYKADLPRNVIPTARTFADILHNVGFGDAAELAALVAEWRGLIDAVGPDLIIFDHSPTALLAARGGTARRVVLGDSFCCPADCAPLPDLRPWLPAEPRSLALREEAVLENMNRVLRAREQPPLERLGQLYGEVDEVMLTTLAEFDYYGDRKRALTPVEENPKSECRNPSEQALTRTRSTGYPASPAYGRGENTDRLETYPTNNDRLKTYPTNNDRLKTYPTSNDRLETYPTSNDRLKTYPTAGGRGETRYRGPWILEGGESPQWPGGSGKKIFAYLKNFSALPHLLEVLRQTGCSTIIHIDGVTPEFAAQHTSATLGFQANRLDLRRAAAECDLAILNGTHGSTVLMLLAGKPILQLPLVLEQELNARATVRLGAGASVSPGRADALAAVLSCMLQSDACGAAARRFAALNAHHSPAEESRRAVEEVLDLLARGE